MGDRSALFTPLAKQAIYYSDITDNLDVNPLTGQLALVINEQDVINSYKRLILMGQHDREYDDLGGNVRKMLFEPMDAATTGIIKSLVENACSHEKRGTIQSIVVNAFDDLGIYVIIVTFTMINAPFPITFQTILRKIR